jgi:hypothetical protein
MTARGMLFVHSCPPALCPHVEWAVAEVLGVPFDLPWTAQPASPGQLRAEAPWRGPVGTAGRIAATLRQWHQLRLEVTEHPSADGDGERYSLTPTLGVYRSAMSVNGDVLIHEDRLRALLSSGVRGRELQLALNELLGRSWDVELEPFRHAGEATARHLLTETG